MVSLTVDLTPEMTGGFQSWRSEIIHFTRKTAAVDVLLARTKTGRMTSIVSVRTAENTANVFISSLVSPRKRVWFRFDNVLFLRNTHVRYTSSWIMCRCEFVCLIFNSRLERRCGRPRDSAHLMTQNTRMPQVRFAYYLFIYFFIFQAWRDPFKYDGRHGQSDTF